ncbi:MAG: J domain-containing protein, partial [Cyanophyceae cyanobacterium]
MNTIDTNEIWIDPWVDPSEALPHSEPVVDPLVQEDLLAFLSEPLELSPADLTPQPRLETPPQPFTSEPAVVAVPGSLLGVTQLSDAEQEAYQLLEVPTWASASELQAAYRNQMQQIHPDRLPAHTPLILRASAEREFKRLQDAYRLLVNRTAPNTHVNLDSVPAQDPPSQSHLMDGNASAGNAGLSDQPQRPSLLAVPVPTEPAGLPLLAQIQTWLGSSPTWVWLAVGGTGAVLGFGLGVLALSTSPASTSTTTGSTVPPTDPISVDPTSLAGA